MGTEIQNKRNETDSEPQEGKLSSEKLKAAKNVIASLIMAFKGYGLYPEDHASSIKILENVKASLEFFLNKHSSIRFHIEKDRLIYSGEIVHQGPASDENIAFILYRDSIQWLEFREGLEQWEILTLFKILKQHRILQDDPEGDIVTALYESDLPHLYYEASEDLWSSEPLLDFSQLNVDDSEKLTPDQSGIDQNQLEERGDEGGDEKSEDQRGGISPSIAEISVDRNKWNLNPQELITLKQMINEDNNRDRAADINDLLMIVLKREDEKDIFSEILEFLKEEFRDLLKLQEFYFATIYLKNIYELYRFCSSEKKWCTPLLANFLKAIFGTKILGAMLPTLQNVHNLEEKQAKILFRLLQYMQPLAIYALAPMLPEIAPVKARQFLINVIVLLTKKNICPLEQLLDGEDETLIQHLIPVLEKLEGRKPIELLLNKMIVHENSQIRYTALTVCISKNCQEFKKLFSLIDDPNENVRTRLLYFISRERNTLNEDLLRQYLEQRKYLLKTKDHILACYRTLGRCGSERSELFLKETLLAGKGRSLLSLGPSIHQIGAALALKALNTENSKATLEKASKSLIPNVRLAYRRATKETNV